MFSEGGVAKKAGEKFLLARYNGVTEGTSKYFLPLNDFQLRLQHQQVKGAASLRAAWDADLSFAAIAEKGLTEGFSPTHVYVDVIPFFISAMRRVAVWLNTAGISATGFDGNVYLDHFSESDELNLAHPTYESLTIRV